jgi:hypothetical protein
VWVGLQSVRDTNAAGSHLTLALSSHGMRGDPLRCPLHSPAVAARFFISRIVEMM